MKPSDNLPQPRDTDLCLSWQSGRCACGVFDCFRFRNFLLGNSAVIMRGREADKIYGTMCR